MKYYPKYIKALKAELIIWAQGTGIVAVAIGIHCLMEWLCSLLP